MNKEEFKKAMKNPKNVYCLVSTDSAMVDLYSKRFKEAIGAELVSHGKIKPYGKLFKKKTLNVLYMPKVDEELFNKKEYIFVYTDSIDKRSSAYKKHKDQFIELKNDYTKYIIEHTGMAEEEAKYLIKISNNDFGLILSAIDAYNESDKDTAQLTDYSSDIYGWVDAYIKKEPLPRCIESPISIMALLSTNCTNLLRVKQKNNAGMNPYIVTCMLKLSPYISEEELVKIIGDCFYLDCQIKKGLIDIDDTINYLILRRYGHGFTNEV